MCHSRDSSFYPVAPGLSGLRTTSQGPLFLSNSLLPRTAFRPLQLMLFLRLRSGWGIVGHGAVLASHPCAWLPTAYKPLLAWQLHSGSSRKSPVAFLSKYLALLQNGDINIYLRRLLLILKSICVKALRALKHITITLMICSSLTHKIQI